MPISNLTTIFGNIVMEAELFCSNSGQRGSHDEFMNQIDAAGHGIFCERGR
jgi:hypothetical protein